VSQALKMMHNHKIISELKSDQYKYKTVTQQFYQCKKNVTNQNLQLQTHQADQIYKKRL
jgi:hypothetical protein